MMIAVFFVAPTLFNGDISSIFHSLFLLPHSAPFFVMVGWSLSFELYFYFIFATTLFVSKNASLQLLFLFSWFLLSFLAGLRFEQQSEFGSFLVSPMHLLFVVGGALKLSYARINKINSLFPLFLLIGLTVYLLATFGLLPTAKNSLEGFSVALIVAVSIFLGVMQSWEKIPKAIAAFLKDLGDASYSLYLSHWMVINVVALVFSRFSYFNALLFTIACVALSIFYSLLTWKFVEITIPKLLFWLFNVKS